MTQSILKNQKFLESENGKMLASMLRVESEEEEPKERKRRVTAHLGDDVTILRDIVKYPKDIQFGYEQIAKQLNWLPGSVRNRHRYLVDNGAKIVLAVDGSVDSIDYPTKRLVQMKRKVSSKFIEGIEVRADVIAGMMGMNTPATILAIANVIDSLSDDDKTIALWEIIKINKDMVIDIIDEMDLIK